MTRPNLFLTNVKLVRDSLLTARTLSREIRKLEVELARELKLIDENKYYLHLGFRSLRGFCHKGLALSKMQSQRLVTLARQSESDQSESDQSESEQIF